MGGATVVEVEEEEKRRYSQHEDASYFAGGSDDVPAVNQRAAGAFEAALLSNANLAGDSVNRGMLVGGIMGLLIGFHNIPAHLVDGLARYRRSYIPAREEESAATSGSGGGLRETVKAFIDRVMRPQVELISSSAAASTASATIPSRFGRPEPAPGFPRLRYAIDPKAGGFGAPRDLRQKLETVGHMRELLPSALQSRLRFLKSTGPVTVPLLTGGIDGRAEDGAFATAVSVPTASAGAGAAAGSASADNEAGLDLDGDAVRDRELFLKGAAAMPAAPSDTSAPAAPTGRVPVKDLHPALLDDEAAAHVLLSSSSTDNSALRALGVEAAPGTGIFYYPGAARPSYGAARGGDDDVEPWRRILQRAFADAQAPRFKAATA